MDWLTFISTTLSSLIWPITVIIILCIYREPISKLFLSLSNLRYKDLSLDFKRDLVELERVTQYANNQDDITDDALDEMHQLQVKARTKQQEIEQVALISPQAAIPLAWNMVEDSMLKAVNKVASVPPELPSTYSPLKHLELLRKHVPIDDETYAALDKMRMMRNEAAHGRYDNGSITANDALEYAGLAQKLVSRLAKY